MITIFMAEGLRHSIEVFYLTDGTEISSYLSGSAGKYFLSFLSDESRQKLDEKGHLLTHREQFAWLPIDNLPWTSDGLPEHERKNLNEFMSQQKVLA